MGLPDPQDPRTAKADTPPVCLYLESTNRCNLHCRSCVRTFTALEPPADMSLSQMGEIVDQVRGLATIVLHGIGEPLLNPQLPAMIRCGKRVGAQMLFNTNGTLLTDARGRSLIEAELDELRVSLDAADPKTYAKLRGAERFDLIARNIRQLVALKAQLDSPRPALSLWLTGMKDTIAQLPAFIAFAARTGVPDVRLQRLVYYLDRLDEGATATPKQALFGRMTEQDIAQAASAQQLAEEQGVRFRASDDLGRWEHPDRVNGRRPWQRCQRPWTLMYITATGNVLPCCIAPFATREYQSLILGNVFRERLADIWNGRRYQLFREALLSDCPPACCRGCGSHWSL